MIQNPYVAGIKAAIIELEDMQKKAFFSNEKEAYQHAIDLLDNLRVSLQIIQDKEPEICQANQIVRTVKKSLG